MVHIILTYVPYDMTFTPIIIEAQLTFTLRKGEGRVLIIVIMTRIGIIIYNLMIKYENDASVSLLGCILEILNKTIQPFF